MEERTAKGIEKQLKRIADSLQRMEPKGEVEAPQELTWDQIKASDPRAGDKVSF